MGVVSGSVNRSSLPSLLTATSWRMGTEPAPHSAGTQRPWFRTANSYSQSKAAAAMVVAAVAVVGVVVVHVLTPNPNPIHP